MVVFPNAKINIGLFVTEKRRDGFHNLETVFYPVGLCDILEINRKDGEIGSCHFYNTGIDIGCNIEENLVVRAYRLLATVYNLPAISIHLHKLIPYGAGLGGGSSDAAFMLKALNEYFDLHLTESELREYAVELGSDCAFFIHNRPAFASGRGEILEDIPLSLENHQTVIIKPAFGVSTPEAYAGIHPKAPGFDLKKLHEVPVEAWKNHVENDFEENVFLKYPALSLIKQQLYAAGAVYASMSGSGSAVYGIFARNCEFNLDFPRCFVWREE